tara:strand:- start:648 stop:797 length:150 start_codon:yes stop_codon:yes gene_type:complete
MVTSNRETKEKKMGNKGHDWGKSKTHPRMPSLMRKKNSKTVIVEKRKEK